MTDLRSDTVTKPTQAMREAMLEADVGDDVFMEDPSINALEEKVARYFGHEAALFCPSGTMTNQIAIKVHTKPGQEVICHELSHIYNYEGGGVAFNSGCQVRTVGGEGGIMHPTEVAAQVQPDDVHKAHSALLVAENTANKGGGTCYDKEQLESLKEVASANGMHFHLDGARLWNALVAKQQNPEELGAIFDSVSVCFSKGLGCPVGSALVGSREFIAEARYIRKKLGGGMRQAGMLAAAVSYAIDHHVERLADDHAKARILDDALTASPLVERVNPVETNIVIFHVKDAETADRFMEEMRKNEVLMVKMGATTLRFVTHLDVSTAQTEQVAEIIAKLKL